MDITSFDGENRFLSNFHPSKVVLDDMEFPSVEAAYQAAKTDDLALRQQMRVASPGKCKRLGKKLKLREDWEQVKIQVMEDLVKQKFTKHEDLREKLLATKDANLVEGNTWGDVFWGVCKGKGKNHLGIILMKVRESLCT